MTTTPSDESMEEPVTCPLCGKVIELSEMPQCEECQVLVCEECMDGVVCKFCSKE